MKQGNNCLLPIRVSGIDPGLVESIQLKFQQGPTLFTRQEVLGDA